MERTGKLVCVLMIALLAVAAATAEPPTEWRPGTAYRAGAAVTYNGATYKCLYAHTAMEGWEPTILPALWAPRDGHTGSAALQAKKVVPPPATRMFAPYVHVTESVTGFSQLQSASGIRYFTLAFIVSDGTCTPFWQGKTPLPVGKETEVSAEIQRVRGRGGEIVISFGGYVGQELAQACSDAKTLQAAYQAVIDRYKARLLDFDVEASAVQDPTSIERRSHALKALAASNPGLQISFTLPATPKGLTESAMNVLKSAAAIGIPVSVVNVMTMDYGYAMPQGNMGPAAIAAADSAQRQLQSLGLASRLGITPMIGMNDSAGEFFTPADARMLLGYARKNSQIARLSMWSLGRDNGGCTGSVSPTCSGIAQGDWEFSQVFREYGR